MARALGLDPGTKRIGVAVSDSGRTMAFPRPAIQAGLGAVDSIVQVVRDEDADVVVVGRPVALSGRETESTQRADEFRHALTSALDVTVIAFDERLSTRTASRELHDSGVRAREQRDVIDSAAAVIVLQSYLDAQNS